MSTCVLPTLKNIADRQSRSVSRSRSRERDHHRGHQHSHRSRSHSRDRRYHSRSRSRSHSRRRHHHSHRSRSYSRSRSRSRSRDRGYKRRRYSRSRSYSRSRRYSRSRSPRRRRSGSPVGRTGVDPETEKFIRTVALKVKDNGESFEDLLRERERSNPKFAFLFDTTVSTFSDSSGEICVNIYVCRRPRIVSTRQSSTGNHSC